MQMQGGATKSMQAHRRGATTQQMRRAARNPKGAWGLGGEYGVARRARPLGSALLLAPCLRPQAPGARPLPDIFTLSERRLVSLRGGRARARTPTASPSADTDG